MKIDGTHYRTIWLAEDGVGIEILDQTRLPHELRVERLNDVSDVAHAIANMHVRGAPLIGATAAYGMALATRADSTNDALDAAYEQLLQARPTAVNLRWALDAMRATLRALDESQRVAAAYAKAAALCDEDVAVNRAIGQHGYAILQRLARAKTTNAPLNILTHCNAGWLATVDWGTATAPIYQAHDAGLSVHVWVGETRPRNQGAALTAFELGQHGVPHTVIVDNLGGHLMQHGQVDVCIVGSDRTSADGDVANKIGTYLKALAAHDNNVPFFVALPSSTVDWSLSGGVANIPIEQRDPAEVTWMHGRTRDGRIESVQVTPESSPALNYAFDVTPSRLVTGLITERGLTEASSEGLRGLFPDAD